MRIPIDDVGNTLLHKAFVAVLHRWMSIDLLQKWINHDPRVMYQKNDNDKNVTEFVTDHVEFHQLIGPHVHAVNDLVKIYMRDDIVLYISSPFASNSTIALICSGLATLGVIGFNAWSETELKTHEGFRQEVILSVLVNFMIVEMPIVFQKLRKDYNLVQRTVGYGRPDIRKEWMRKGFGRAYTMLFSFFLNHIWGNQVNVALPYRMVSIVQAVVDMSAIYSVMQHLDEGFLSEYSKYAGFVAAATFTVSGCYTTGHDYFERYQTSQRSRDYQALDMHQTYSESLLSNGVTSEAEGAHSIQHPHDGPAFFRYVTSGFAAVTGLIFSVMKIGVIDLAYTGHSFIEETHIGEMKELSYMFIGLLALSSLTSIIYSQGFIPAKIQHAAHQIMNVFHHRSLMSHDGQGVSGSLFPLGCLIGMSIVAGYIAYSMGYVQYELFEHLLEWLKFPHSGIRLFSLLVGSFFAFGYFSSYGVESMEKAYELAGLFQQELRPVWDCLKRQCHRLNERCSYHVRLSVFNMSRDRGYSVAPGEFDDFLTDSSWVDHQENHSAIVPSV